MDEYIILEALRDAHYLAAWALSVLLAIILQFMDEISPIHRFISGLYGAIVLILLLTRPQWLLLRKEM